MTDEREAMGPHEARMQPVYDPPDLTVPRGDERGLTRDESAARVRDRYTEALCALADEPGFVGEVPFDPAKLRLFAGSVNVTELFTIAEVDDGYTIDGPYERVTHYSVEAPRTSLRLTSPPLDSHTRAQVRVATEKGEPCPWVVPKNIRVST